MRPLLATIAPSFGDAFHWDDSDRARLLLMDATARWLEALAAEGPHRRYHAPLAVNRNVE